VPTRADIETVLVQLVFQDELVLEAACGLPKAEQAVRERLDRVTDALMTLIEGRWPTEST
jgi:hypothetical protein